jgi:hypothetical protein
LISKLICIAIFKNYDTQVFLLFNLQTRPMLFTFRNIDLWLCFFFIIFDLLVIINLSCLISSLLVWSMQYILILQDYDPFIVYDYASCFVGHPWLNIARFESFLPCNFGCVLCCVFLRNNKLWLQDFSAGRLSTDHQQHHGRKMALLREL